MYQHKQWGFTFVVGYLVLVVFLVPIASVGGGMPDLFMVAILAMFALALPIYSRLMRIEYPELSRHY